MNRTFGLGLLMLTVTLPAFAQTTPATPPATPRPSPVVPENGRFTMTPSGDGFLRLDTRSGAVSFCTVKDGAANCRSSADERGALEAEIGRLAGENSKLKGAAPMAQAPAAAQAPATAQAPAAPQTLTSSLPTDAEVDHAIGLLDKIVRGTIRIMKEVDSSTPD